MLTTARKHPERHIAHQANPHGFCKSPPGLRDPSALIEILNLFGSGNIPVTLDLELRSGPVDVQNQMMPGHQLADVAEERAVLARVAEREHFGKQFLLKRGRN